MPLLNPKQFRHFCGTSTYSLTRAYSLHIQYHDTWYFSLKVYVKFTFKISSRITPERLFFMANGNVTTPLVCPGPNKTWSKTEQFMPSLVAMIKRKSFLWRIVLYHINQPKIAISQFFWQYTVRSSSMQRTAHMRNNHGGKGARCNF